MARLRLPPPIGRSAGSTPAEPHDDSIHDPFLGAAGATDGGRMALLVGCRASDSCTNLDSACLAVK